MATEASTCLITEGGRSKGSAGGNEASAAVAVAILTALGEAVVAVAPDDRVLYLNSAAEMLTGWDSSEALGRGVNEVLEVVPADGSSPIVGRSGLRTLLGDGPIFLLRRRDGGHLPVEFSIAPLRRDDGSSLGSVLSFRDISERVRQARDLSLFRTLFYNTGEAVVITDIDARIVDVNPAFVELTGYSREEARGQNPRLIKSDRHETEFYRGMWNGLLEAGHWQGEVWDRRKNGEVFPAWMTINAVYVNGEEPSHYVSVLRDITQVKQREERLVRLAHHDPLTGLPNRCLCLDRVEQALVRAVRHGNLVAVMFLDLDGFKQINDTFGHRAGDQLLQSVAQRLHCCVRQEDTVSRLAGDEFVVVLEELDSPHSAARVATKIRDTLAEPVPFEGREMRTAASIGIAVFPYAGQEADDLLKAADSAMYRAKQRGGGYEFFRHRIDSAARCRQQLEQDLYRAMERLPEGAGGLLGNGEFQILFQPQVAIASGRVEAAEALLRWRHPQMGTLLPAAFLSIAEASGVILPLGRRILRSACEQACRWRGEAGDGWRVAVNIGGQEISRGDLIDAVRDALEESGLEPERLELEVDAAVLERFAEVALPSLEQLEDLGVGLALNDFGRGALSLRTLARLPVRRVKLSQALVAGMGVDTQGDAMVRASLALARSLDLTVVAVGVEHQAQLQRLSEWGCNAYQGELFSPPAAGEAVKRLVA